MKKIRKIVLNIFDQQITTINKRQRNLSIDPSVTIVADTYAPKLSFAYITPKDCQTPNNLPLIINVHGGAFATGSKENNLFFAATLAKQGFQVAVIDYRLVPQVNLKQQVQDVARAINYIVTKYPFQKLFLTGDSSGSYLVELINRMNSDGAVQKVFGISLSLLSITGLGLFGAPNTIEIFPKWLFPLAAENKAMLLSTCAEITPYLGNDYLWSGSIPPVFIISAKEDIYYQNCLHLKKQLDSLGILNDGYFAKKNHLYHCYNVIDPINNDSQAANKALIAFFKSLL